MRALLFTLSLSLLIDLTGQVDDMISLGAGYTHQSFYSLENGEVANVDNTDWDIAFMSDPFNSSVLINDNIGTQLYLYSNDITEWNEVDTAGMDWTPIYNSELRWTGGAFIQPAAESDVFDYGWGQYNIITHVVEGNRIFILELADGTFKKLIIEELDLGTYTFKYADLSGQVEIQEVVSGSDYSDKNFWYYSLQNGSVIDREPSADSWDITFTRYISEIFPGANYLVSGAFQNIDVMASESRSVEVDDAQWTDHSFSDDINVIGSDWKYFDLDALQYMVEDSLSYFVQDLEGNVWQIIFTDFDGSSSGDIEFTKEMVSATGLNEEGVVDFTLFPNPSAGTITAVVAVENSPITYSLIDLNGRVVLQDSWNTGLQHQLDLHGLQSGVYLLQIQKEGSIGQQRLILK